MEEVKKIKVQIRPRKPVVLPDVNITNIDTKLLTVTNPLRTRHLLFGTRDGEVRAKLRGKLPKTNIPDKKSIAPPLALMNLIKKCNPGLNEPSQILGIVVEHLLRSKCSKLDYTLVPIELNLIELEKTVEKSPSFLNAILETIKQLNILYEGKEPKYDIELGCGHVIGHPDIVVGTHIYEVKWTTQLKKQFSNFMMQLFTYGAMEPNATHLHLVLPAQSTIISWNLKEWGNRELYRSTLLELAQIMHHKHTKPNFVMQYRLLCLTLNIGCHIGRNPGQNLCQFVINQDNDFPTQLFLQGHLSSKVDTITDDELVKMNEHVINYGQRIYVHAPYSINLCMTPGSKDDYGVKSLIYNLQSANTAGFLGVVVHTGKLPKSKPEYSMEYMESNIWKALAYATEECPLLIETPAREGQEQLNDPEELAMFISKFHKDCSLGTKEQMKRKIGMCIDTCHIFSAGHLPMDYLEVIDCFDPGMIKLIHYNDSLYGKGCCKDRHERLGLGEIPCKQMSKFAYICSQRNIPMLTE